jgi:hypothetical protein
MLERNMSKRNISQRKELIVLVAAAILASSGPVLAATFYIVREGRGPCHVVEGHPPATVTIIGGNKTYTTREAAEKDLALACKTG